MNEAGTIAKMLQARTIAVIGLSADETKPSHYVPAFMQKLGHRIVPVNPMVEFVLGEKCYPSLAALPEKPDLVNVFRLPRFISGIVDEMIELGMTALWTQVGIVDGAAAAKAEAHGIAVVMDRCLMVEARHAGAMGGAYNWRS